MKCISVEKEFPKYECAIFFLLKENNEMKHGIFKQSDKRGEEDHFSSL